MPKVMGQLGPNPAEPPEHHRSDDGVPPQWGLDKQRLTAMLRFTAELWRENAARLSDIDSRFGDGDHGVTMGKIAALILDKTGQAEGWTIHDLICSIGDGIMGISGGSAGPLYGTLVGGLAEPLTDQNEIDGPLLKSMLAASLAEMRTITKAAVGDKTMMDALIPAVEAAAIAPNDPASILAAASEAAARGAEATREMISKFGRARSYGEKTIGTEDAGALSTALFFQGLAGGFNAA